MMLFRRFLRAHFKTHRFEASVATVTDIIDKGGIPFKGDVVHGGGQRDVTPGVGAPLRRGDIGDGGDERPDRTARQPWRPSEMWPRGAAICLIGTSSRSSERGVAGTGSSLLEGREDQRSTAIEIPLGPGPSPLRKLTQPPGPRP